MHCLHLYSSLLTWPHTGRRCRFRLRRFPSLF
jgi:hypothetical protein